MALRHVVLSRRKSLRSCGVHHTVAWSTIQAMSLPVLPSSSSPGVQAYDALLEAVSAIVLGERDWIANLANISALIGLEVRDITWAGFYLWRGGELVLGPFFGRPACIRIAAGRGVCGTAVARQATVVVADVHDFPGHIVCDSRSRSEIVVPLLGAGRLFGVLDLDAPTVGRFGEGDRMVLERLAQLVVESIVWPSDVGCPTTEDS